MTEKFVSNPWHDRVLSLLAIFNFQAVPRCCTPIRKLDYWPLGPNLFKMYQHSVNHGRWDDLPVDRFRRESAMHLRKQRS